MGDRNTHFAHQCQLYFFTFSNILIKILEARAGIEPAYTDLQSAASPLCHRAFMNGFYNQAFN